MRLMGSLLGVGIGLMPLAAVAAGEVSVDRGAHVAVTSGCHDCHTANYNETGGKVDPAAALAGVPVGWQGPWGTTYAANLRFTVKDMTEDAFLEFARTFETRPPMPWYNVHAMEESDLRSLFLYIKALGDPGNPMPEALPPGVEPTTPYLIMMPVQPKG